MTATSIKIKYMCTVYLSSWMNDTNEVWKEIVQNKFILVKPWGDIN